MSLKRSSDTLTAVVNLSLRSIRIIIFDDTAQKVYEDWLPIRTYVNGVSVEQDPNEWWQLFVELLKKVFSDSSIGTRIRFMTVTSSALCLVPVDKNGHVLHNAMMVSDKRAFEESEFIKKRFPDLFEGASAFKAEPSFMLPKILWLKKNEPTVFAHTYRYMSSNDFLFYKLTGQYMTDELNAEKFYFHTKKNLYHSRLLATIGVRKSQLPPVRPIGEYQTTLSRSACAHLGISQKIYVILGTYDAIAALIGSSTYQPGELNNVCGTCSSYRMFVDTPLVTDRLVLQYLSGERLYIVGASNNLEGGVLEWAKECFYGDSYRKDDQFLYDLIQTEAQESTLGANGILFLPYLLGERMPFLDSDVRGTFFGIERFHTRKDFVRSIFESMCFQAKLMLTEFHKSDIDISSVNMSGGVSKLPFAAQLRADILGLPVNVIAEAETTALGAFIITLKTRGVIQKMKQAKHMVQVSRRYIPNMHNHNCYSSLFLLYKELYGQNKEIFKKRRQVLKNINVYKKKILENL